MFSYLRLSIISRWRRTTGELWRKVVVHLHQRREPNLVVLLPPNLARLWKMLLGKTPPLSDDYHFVLRPASKAQPLCPLSFQKTQSS